jgi:hypothetical protein
MTVTSEVSRVLGVNSVLLVGNLVGHWGPSGLAVCMLLSWHRTQKFP